ncbi:MAG: hypothetical protein JSV82_05600, partial [Planctomycetota bacterium]
TLEDKAIICADGTTVYPLLYAQELKKRRRDIRIVSSHAKRKNPVQFDELTIPQLLTETSIYVVSPAPGYCPDYLLKRYDFVKAGSIYRVLDVIVEKK